MSHWIPLVRTPFHHRLIDSISQYPLQLGGLRQFMYIIYKCALSKGQQLFYIKWLQWGLNERLLGYWPSGLTPMSDYCMSETLSHDELHKLLVAILNSLSDTYMLEVYIHIHVPHAQSKENIIWVWMQHIGLFLLL